MLMTDKTTSDVSREANMHRTNTVSNKRVILPVRLRGLV